MITTHYNYKNDIKGMIDGILNYKFKYLLLNSNNDFVKVCLKDVSELFRIFMDINSKIFIFTNNL